MKTIKEFCPSDRYAYDFGPCSFKKGFAQVDTGQDASYYGTWANPFKRVIVCYCEGDVYTTICDNDSEFVAEIRGIKAWNEENEHRFGGIDPACQPEMIERFESMGLEDLLH